MRGRVASFAAAIALAAVASCNAVPLLAPTNSIITLTASALTVALNGSVDVAASILEQPGTAVHDGTQVRFTTTLGAIDPPTVLTSGGVVTATFRAGGVSGIAEILAVSGAATGGTGEEASNVVSITVGAAAADLVTLTAMPSTLPSVGGTATITARVLDISGNGLPGITVSFGTDAGTLSVVAAVTDAAGRATVTLTTTQEANVTATMGSVETAAAEVTVGIAIAGTVTLTCQPEDADNANCTQTVGSPVSLTAASGADGAAITSATIDFGDGSMLSVGPLASNRTVTHQYAVGTYTAVLRATDANGEQTEASVAIRVQAKAPFGVMLTVSPTTTPEVGQTVVTFTAALTPTGTDVQVVSYEWTFLEPTGATERSVSTSGGSVGHVFEMEGIYTVQVVVTADDGRTATAETQIFIGPVVP